MSKKHPSGFVPIQFRVLGKVLLPISFIMVVASGLDFIFGWEIIPFAVMYIGLIFLLLSLYLLFVVPKE